jgi:alkaline phosphatase D
VQGAHAQSTQSDTEEPLTKLAFGSCSDPDLSQPLWSAINAFAPNVWLWGGDIVYADLNKGFLWKTRQPLEALSD